MLSFWEVLGAVLLGWVLCTITTQLFVLRFAQYVDVKMLPKPKTVQGGQVGMALATNTPALQESGQLVQTEPISQLV